FGGALFLGAFVYGVGGLREVGGGGGRRLSPGLRRLQAFLLAATAGTATALLSLSRVYSLPTYIMLGLGTVYLRLAPLPVRVPTVNSRLVARLVLVGLAFLPVAHLVVTAMARWN